MVIALILKNYNFYWWIINPFSRIFKRDISYQNIMYTSVDCKDTHDRLCIHGSVAILVHNFVHSQEIALQSTLPVVAVKVTITHLSFIVCSLYLPYLQLTSLNLFFELLHCHW